MYFQYNLLKICGCGIKMGLTFRQKFGIKIGLYFSSLSGTFLPKSYLSSPPDVRSTCNPNCGSVCINARGLTREVRLWEYDYVVPVTFFFTFILLK